MYSLTFTAGTINLKVCSKNLSSALEHICVRKHWHHPDHPHGGTETLACLGPPHMLHVKNISMTSTKRSCNHTRVL